MKIDVFEFIKLGGRFVFREGAQRFYCSFGDDRDASREGLDLFHVVGREKDRGSGFVKFADEGPEFAAEFDVDTGGWFIEDEKLWFMDQGFADQEATFHAAGEFTDGGVGDVGKGEASEDFIGPAIFLFYIEETGLDLEGFARGEERIEVYFLRH